MYEQLTELVSEMLYDLIYELTDGFKHVKK